MEDINMVSEALKFMALGMGIVFLFLSIMIVLLKVQAKLINKFFAEKPKAQTTATKEWQPNNEDDKQVAAAITAAIIHHNNKG